MSAKLWMCKYKLVITFMLCRLNFLMTSLLKSLKIKFSRSANRRVSCSIVLWLAPSTLIENNKQQLIHSIKFVEAAIWNKLCVCQFIILPVSLNIMALTKKNQISKWASMETRFFFTIKQVWLLERILKHVYEVLYLI